MNMKDYETAAGKVTVTVPYQFDLQEYSYQVELTPERAKEAVARAAKELCAEYNEEAGDGAIVTTMVISAVWRRMA